MAGSRQIPITLHWRDRRTLGLSVAPETKVDAYIPKRARHRDVKIFLQKKSDWIQRKLEEQEKYHRLPRPEKYVSGDPLTFLGRQYQLKVLSGTKVKAEMNDRYLLVTVHKEGRNGTVKKTVENWYRQRAKEIFAARLTEGIKIAFRNGITTEPELHIRKMRRRLGSCYPEGKIILNTNLIQTPMESIDYVIMHELCHLNERNHKHDFYSLLSRCMPDWRQRKEELNRFILS